MNTNVGRLIKVSADYDHIIYLKIVTVGSNNVFYVLGQCIDTGVG